MTGAWAKATAVGAIRQRYPDLITRLPVLGPFLEPGAPALSYTQWEAWLALYHGKVLIIAVPQDGAPRDEPYPLVEEQRAAQQTHLVRLANVGRYAEIHFASADRLAVDMLRSKLQDILAVTGPMKKPSTSSRGSEASVRFRLRLWVGPWHDDRHTQRAEHVQPMASRLQPALGQLLS